jgi:hypothetical protein
VFIGVGSTFVVAVARSERPGDGETGLLSELLGLARGAEHAGESLTLSALLGLPQSSGYVRSSQVLVADVHRDVL